MTPNASQRVLGPLPGFQQDREPLPEDLGEGPPCQAVMLPLQWARETERQTKENSQALRSGGVTSSGLGLARTRHLPSLPAF